METEPWYDLTRKTFDSREEAIAAIDKHVPIMGQMTKTILDRKLATGFEIVGDVVIDHIHVIDVIENRHELLHRKGTAYIEVKTIATLRKVS